MKRVTRPAVGFLLVTLAVLGAGSRPASAQYFGRNKVQWERLEFKVLKTEHFDIYYYAGEARGGRAGRPHGRALVRAALARARAQVQGPPADRALREPAALPADQHHRRRTGEGTGGVTEASSAASCCRSARRSPRPITCWATSWCTRSSTTSTGQGQQAARHPGRSSMPLWFIEGMAEYLSVGPRRPAHGDVDARRRPRERQAAHDPAARRQPATSPIATARRSGPTSAGASATP